MADGPVLDYATHRPTHRPRGCPYWVIALVAAPAALWTAANIAFATQQRDTDAQFVVLVVVIFALPAWIPALICWLFRRPLQRRPAVGTAK